MRHFLLKNSIVTSLVLFLSLLFSSIDSAAQIRLAWNPNTEPDLAGYKVYYGTASRTYGPHIDVGNVTICTVPGLTLNVTYYFAVTAYDTSHNESGYSNEVSGKITETITTPYMLSGPTSGVPDTSYTYIAGGSSSSLGHGVEYQFDWQGTGTDLSPWGSTSQSKTWTLPGTYNVRARSRCAIHTSVISPWLGPISVTISQTMTQTGSLQVTISPQGAIDSGAQWRRVGTSTWRNSGSTETGIPAGQHTVEFSNVSGWAKPGNQALTISNGRTALAIGTYTTQVGSLQLIISPQGAIDAGAQWRVDGGVWHGIEYTQTGLSVDQHMVEFSDVSGWTKPGNQTVAISDGQTTLAIGSYSQ